MLILKSAVGITCMLSAIGDVSSTLHAQVSGVLVGTFSVGSPLRVA